MMKGLTIVFKLGALSRFISYIGNFAIAGMMFLTTADVIGRYFFNYPVLGAYEITEYLMLIMVFAFLAFTQSEKAHISVDIVFIRLPRRIQAFINRFNHLVCLLLMIFVTWRGIHNIFDMEKSGEASTLLKIPDYPFAIFLVIGTLALCLEFLRDVLEPNSIHKEHKAS